MLLYKLEIKLSHIAGMNETTKWQSLDLTEEREAIEMFHKANELIECNRFFLTHELSENILTINNDCLKILGRMITSKKCIGKELNQDTVINQWRLEEMGSVEKIKKQKLELAQRFREIIGVK